MKHEQAIRDMAARGMTRAEIARELGVSRQRVYELGKKIGVSFVDGRFYRAKQSAIAAPKPRVLTGGVPCKISHSAAGVISELLVAADLMARGYQVYMPVIASRGHDVIAVSGSEILTFEVRSAYRNKAGNLIFARKADSPSQHHALVVTGEPVSYDPPLD